MVAQHTASVSPLHTSHPIGFSPPPNLPIAGRLSECSCPNPAPHFLGLIIGLLCCRDSRKVQATLKQPVCTFEGCERLSHRSPTSLPEIPTFFHSYNVRTYIESFQAGPRFGLHPLTLRSGCFKNINIITHALPTSPLDFKDHRGV